MAWENILDAEEIDEKCERFYQCNITTEKAYDILNNFLPHYNGDTDIKNDLTVFCECFCMGKMLTRLLTKYMEIYKNLDNCLCGKKDFDSDYEKVIISLQQNAAEFTNYVNSNKAKPVDKFDGIFIGRRKLAKFLEENTALMLKSFRSKERLPNGNKNMKTQDWTE